MHDFVSLPRVLFANGDEHEVVKYAFSGKRDIHDFREIHPKHREKNTYTRCAHVEIFHRRNSDNSARIHRVVTMSDRGDVKDGVRIDRRIKAGMIAEGAFGAEFTRLNVAFDDKVDVRRNFERNGETGNEVYRFFSDKPGEQDFVETIGQRSSRGEGVRRIAADGDSDGHGFVAFVVTFAVTRAYFVNLPMHAGSLGVVHLDAVHPEVAITGIGVFGMDAREGDETPAVVWPALEDGEVEKGRECGGGGLVSGGRGSGVESMDDFLAGPGLGMRRFGVEEVESLHGEVPSGAQVRRRFGLHDELHLMHEGVDGIEA